MLQFVLGLLVGCSLPCLAQAHRCEIMFVPEAKLPGLEIGSAVDCRKHVAVAPFGAVDKSGAACNFEIAGVTHHATDNLLILKEISDDQLPRLKVLPFGFGPNETLLGALDKIEAAQKAPMMNIGVTESGYVLTTDLCLATTARGEEEARKPGAEEHLGYELEVYFNKQGLLRKIVERVAWP